MTTTTLHIEHPITSYDTWKEAFDRFAEARTAAGVRSHHITQPVDDARFVSVDLGFDSAEEASRFLVFLRDRVWPDRAASPALAGEVVARLVETRERA